jgi:putative transposase
MTKKRRQYSARYKFEVALEAAKESQTLSELASETGVHPTQISHWKRQLQSEGSDVFERKRSRQAEQQTQREAELYEQIGRLKMELEWLKKKAARFA